MSVINRIPMYDDPTFTFQIPLYCPDVYVVPVAGDRIQPNDFVNYLDAADGKPIYKTRDSRNDIQIPSNYDNSIYNLYKSYPNSMNAYGYVTNYSYVAIPLVNWDTICENLPYYTNYQYSMFVKFLDTAEYNHNGELYSLDIYIDFYGHIVETDQIKQLGVNSSYILDFWHSDQFDGEILTGNFPSLLYKEYYQHRNWYYRPEEIDQVWVCIRFPYGGGYSYAYADYPTDPDYRYKMYLSDFFVTCTGYNPKVYI